MSSKDSPMDVAEVDIDESLYSRQLYVMGREAQRRMAVSNVLIVGLNGLGVEVAKNIILAGVKSVALCDATPVTIADLTSQFYLSEVDCGISRSEISAPKLAKLNPYVHVHILNEDIVPAVLDKFTVVVLIETSWDKQIEISTYCHANNISIIIADVAGVYGTTFCDFGSSFVVSDVNGEAVTSTMIAAITKSSPAIVSVLEDSRHGLETGDTVVITDVEGMDALNKREFVVTVKDPYSFEIPVDTSEFPAHVRGGYVTQVKKPVTVQFDPLIYSVKHPGSFAGDWVKSAHAPVLHLAFR